MKKQVIQQLVQHVNELLDISRQIRLENKQLNSEKALWLIERKQLVEKANLARDHLEKIAARLKELENEL